MGKNARLNLWTRDKLGNCMKIFGVNIEFRKKEAVTDPSRYVSKERDCHESMFDFW